MAEKNIETNNKISELLQIMGQLREPKNGCPWDLQQNFESIAPYTIEEAYEVAEAIQQADMPALRDELGDLLFQVVFHSRLAEEQELFNFDDVVTAICEKLTHRHPHVFAGENVPEELLANRWEAEKRKEKEGDGYVSVLNAVSVHQPAMNQAYKLQKKAASVGFDWASIEPVIEKLDEEISEIKHEIKKHDNQRRIEEELGDVLFSCINLARHVNVDPEWSLRGANKRFSERFTYIEQQLNSKRLKIEDCSIEMLDELWNEAKKIIKRDADSL
ncbi:MAG: nucleoside triphosphate pyrophosphohydrolase [Cycloclasticus sp.]|nr:MAG: nucleoside triphosphate pyrophosphohydrolase [Cycloclasticus sp.]